MTLTVRSLLAKVRPFRKDLTEEDAIFAIQECVRKICRQTLYAKSVLSVDTVATEYEVDVAALLTGGSVLRVTDIRLLDPTQNAYRILTPVNFETVNKFETFRNLEAGYPTAWTYKGDGLVELYPTPDDAYTLELTVAIVPTGEIETIPLPDEAEDAIVAGALGTLLMLPGSGQNLGLAKDREILYNRESDALKASAMFGQTSRARMTGPTNSRW